MLQQLQRHWRHFRPQRPHQRHRHHQYDNQLYRRRDFEKDKPYITPPQDVQFVCDSTDFFDCAEEEAVSLLQRRPEVNDLERDIDHLKQKFARTNLAHDGMVSLLAQAPRAALAQIQMDQHPHGYRNKQERLFELIDFNDTLVATVQLLSDTDRVRFASAAKVAADRICQRVGAPCFTNEQWDAIVRGLTREIAVYWAAKNNGFNVLMTTRAQDALGIDLQIQDPQTHRYINVDVKTPSAFRYRLETLVEEGRLSPHEQLVADEQSFALQLNGHGRKIEIVLLCILPDKFGDLADFRFVDEAPMRDMLNMLIQRHGLTDGKFGIV